MWDRLLVDCRIATFEGMPGNPLGLARDDVIISVVENIASHYTLHHIVMQHGTDAAKTAKFSLGPNAVVGIGLANIYGRKKGSNWRMGDPPQHSRKPAVTFIMKF